MLEDTSFAIHPGAQKDMNSKNYIDIGSVHSYKQVDHLFRFSCTNGTVDIIFYTAEIIRVIMQPNEQSKTTDSRAVVANPDIVKVAAVDQEQQIVLTTEAVKLEINKALFRLKIYDANDRIIVSETEKGMGFKHSGEVICYKMMTTDDHFYGFGEKTGFLDKRGEKLEMWNSDVYAPHNPETDPLYQTIPYFMTVRNGNAYGIFFDNTYRTVFDMKSSKDYYSFSAEGGPLNYYIFAGPTPKKVVEQYTYVTGRMPLPPKWALGYHQSRYSYRSEQEVKEIVQTFIEKEIPLDAIYFDIHYMNGYRVFTFDKQQFPNPTRLIKELMEQGVHVVPIVDPGVKKDPEYSIYQEGMHQDLFCKYIDGKYYYGEVWPGVSAFPDFTEEKVRKWWGEKHKFYTDMGIEGIWNDMNEPAVFNEEKTMDVEVFHRNDGNPMTHRALHNIYGFLMGKATYEGMQHQLEGKRPFLLTRAGYAGVQRYATVWTGDNRSFWEHLQMSLPMCMNLGLSGVAFSGPDVGGFAHDTSGELLTRWTQVGAFMPYFRNHSAIGTLYQEPWRFGEDYETIIKKYIQLRYRWMPHFYSLFYQASETGLPVMRPLMMEFPDDEKTYNLNDQFMVGDNVMIAPILTPGTTDRAVYFPDGVWVDHENMQEYKGQQVYLIHAELDKLPLFVKKGTAIAQGNVVQSTETEQDEITIEIFANDQEGTYDYTFYDDDGKTMDDKNNKFMVIAFEIKTSKSEVELKVKRKTGEYLPPYRHINVVFHGLKGQMPKINRDKLKKDTGISFSQFHTTDF